MLFSIVIMYKWDAYGYKKTSNRDTVLIELTLY